jgi:hypothetical protein
VVGRVVVRRLHGKENIIRGMYSKKEGGDMKTISISIFTFLLCDNFVHLTYCLSVALLVLVEI